MKKVFVVFITILFHWAVGAQSVPVTPAWAFGHIVWEDNVNTTKGAEDIVAGYLDRGIPVDAVIIDSPWSLSYNDFTWDKARYADPAAMIRGFQEKGVKVILWLTGNVNLNAKDTPVPKAFTYDEMQAKGYGVNDSQPYQWWKGEGMHLDFTNPAAVQWWYGQLDRVFVDGVYGFKVDQGEHYLGNVVKTSKGEMSKKDFGRTYYDAMFDYAVSRKDGGITIARPYSHQGGFAASVGKMNLGWCGDFSGDWRGMKLQINNIYRSSQGGYAAVACEVGGFYGRPSNGEQLIRYAQFGAMTACMINGGENGAFTNHLPWYHGEAEAQAYTDAVALNEQLRPYKFSTVVEAHLHGGTLVRGMSFEQESHRVGEALFTKVLSEEGGHAVFSLPSEGEWIDWWTGERFLPGARIDRTWVLDRFPLFVRAGSVLPLATDRGLTLRIYPNGKTSEVLHLPEGDGTAWYDCRVSYDERSGRLEINSDHPLDLTVTVVRGGKQVSKHFSGSRISGKVK